MRENNAQHRSAWDLFMINMQLGFTKSLLVLPTQWLQVMMRYQQSIALDEEKPRILKESQAFHELAPKAKAVFKSPTQSIQAMLETGRKNAEYMRDHPPKLRTSIRYPWINPVFAFYHRQNQRPAAVLMRGTFQANPFYNLFKGTVPSMTKEALKNGVYKGLFIVKVPDWIEFALSYTSLDKNQYPIAYHVVKSSAAALGISAIDVFFGGALDAWATHAATAQGKHAKASFTKEVLNEKSLSK